MNFLFELLKVFGFLIVILSNFSGIFINPALCQSNAASEDSSNSWVHLVEPGANTVNTAKRLIIRFKITVHISKEDILIFLDGTDITQMLEINGEEFYYRPVDVMPAGVHTLEIVDSSDDIGEIRETFTFSTRHSEKFEEAYSENQIDATYKTLLDKCDDLTDVNHYILDANLSTMSRLKEGNFDTTLTGNFRHLRQYLPVQPPEEEHFSLKYYLWETNYTRDRYGFHSDVGDIQVNESPNTAEGIARRGGKMTHEYNPFYINAFSVKSKELFGFNGGTGIGASEEDHILGGSVGARFFSDSLELKLIRVRGGEEDISFGFWAEETMKKGEVTGGLIKSSLFEDRLQMEVEYDAAEYDENTEDLIPAEKDHAFRAQAGGYLKQFTWGMGYEYFGPEYQVIGNPFLYRDKEGVNFEAGAGFEISSLNLTYIQYNDNVEKDPLVVRITTKEFGLDYSFTMFQDFLFNATYQRVVEKSSMEPDPFSTLRNYTDTYSGLITYALGNWNLGLQTTHSFQDDRTINNYDTTTRSYSVTPSYTSERFILSPSFSFDTTRDHFAHISTDSYTASFNSTLHIWLRKLIWEMSGTYNKVMTSDQLTDDRIFSGSYKLSYMFETMGGFKDTSLSIEGTYQLSRDKKTEIRDHDHTVYLVLSTTLPFSF